MCPKRRPLRPHRPVVRIVYRGGLHFGRLSTSSRSPAGSRRGNCIIRDLTRRRHTPSQLLMLQNPHTRRHERRASRQHRAHCRLARNTSPNTPPPTAHPRKTRPASPKTPNLGCCERAGRTISRTGRSNVAALKPITPLHPLTQANVKPPSPLLTLEQQPLKPVAPLQPKNTPKTPISHPQRR